jgi:transposase
MPPVLGATGGKTFYEFSSDFLCKLFAVNCFELEDPGTVFDLIKVAEWTRIAPLLPARETRGTYYADHRRVLKGMLYRHATGCAWRDLPPRYGPWSTVASRQRRWTHEGLWGRILAALQGELAEAGRIDWELWCIDGSHVRAHRVAAGAGENRPPGEPADHALGRSRGGFTTKLHLVTDGHGLPLAVALSAGQAHESVHATRVLDAVRVPRRRPGRPLSFAVKS